MRLSEKTDMFAHKPKLILLSQIIIIIIIGGKGRQQLLIEPTITNLNKLQFTKLQMFCELV